MDSSDILLTISIIIIFIILYIFFYILGRHSNIKLLWTKYRCNPVFMPLAKLFGYDPITNFNNCVQNVQQSYISELLLPVNYNINALQKTGDEMNTSIVNTYKFIDRFRDDIKSIVESIMGKLLNLTINMKKETINIQDALLRLTSTITTLTYIADEQTKFNDKTKYAIKKQKTDANKSIQQQRDWWADWRKRWAKMIKAHEEAERLRKEREAAAEARRQEKCVYDKLDADVKKKIKISSAQASLECKQAVCFHPETLVKNNNGKTVPIKNIKVGSFLKNGQKVLGTMILNNLTEDNSYNEDLYSLVNGEKGENILVSGSHLIYDKTINNYIKVKDFTGSMISYNNSETLICLITTDHTIPLGDYIFHDWEDNNGSPSKNL